MKSEQIHLTQPGISLLLFTLSSRPLDYMYYDLYAAHRYAIHDISDSVIGF